MHVLGLATFLMTKWVFNLQSQPMEQHALKNVTNCFNTSIYSYLETSGGQSFNLHLNVVHFFNASVD
jgi:hypothetical protein